MFVARHVLITLTVALSIVVAACAEEQGDDSVGDQPSTTPTPEAGHWYDLLASEKTYPEGKIGEELLELAEREDRYRELWQRFELEDEPPAVDWTSRVVLFAGTGESGTCPLYLNQVEFDPEQRLITIDAPMDVPEGTVCTADWTPRVFVIAMNAETLGEGELRAMFFRRGSGKEPDPDDGELIREG